MAKRTYLPKETWDRILEEYTQGATPVQLIKKYNLKEPTLYTRLKRLRDSGKVGFTSYTSPDHLTEGDRAMVVDGAIEKDNGKLITITKVGKIFIEGVDENNKPVAAYKVKKVAALQPTAAPEKVAPIIEPNPEPVKTVESLPASDEIIWERKLVYDIQTTNHLYRVKVETNTIEILNGESDVITINRDRVADISLILKNLPALLEEK